MTTNREPWNAKHDAEALFHALKGISTDDTVLVDIFGSRSRTHLQEVKAKFNQMYVKSLESCITINCSGNFEQLLLNLCHERTHLKCDYLRKAEAKIGSQEYIIIQTICSCSHQDLEKLKKTYHEMYGQDLTSIIESEPEGDFKDLLLKLLRAAPTSSELVVDDSKASAEAQILVSMGEGKLGADNGTLIPILTHRSRLYTQKVRQFYEEKAGFPFENSLAQTVSDDFRKVVLALTTPQAEYFADLFHDAFDREDNEQVVRLMTTMTKGQLNRANDVFSEKYKRSLQAVIMSQSTGAYKELLCNLIIQKATN